MSRHTRLKKTMNSPTRQIHRFGSVARWEYQNMMRRLRRDGILRVPNKDR